MTIKKTRIFNLPSSLKNEYAIVSLPENAWDWIDDMLGKKSYAELIKEIPSQSCAESLTLNLRRKAQEGYENKMSAYYNLANDNTPANGYGDLKSNPALPESPSFVMDYPSVFQLLEFIPHATYLTTIWERRRVAE